MLQGKVIEIGLCDYTSLMILVKALGKYPRPLIDYRRLNEIIRTGYYLLPNIEQRIGNVTVAKYIPFLDLAKGY